MDEGCTQLLIAAGRGDAEASGQLFARLYEELRHCARRQLRGRAGSLVSTTVLVHETYLKLIHAERLEAGSRGHFMALAARAMRQVLVDHARRRQADKRGGDAIFVTLDERAADAAGAALEVLALDRALTSLEQIDARAARVVSLHFFGGLSFPAIAEIEGLNERTVKRDWQAARLLLADQIRGNA